MHNSMFQTTANAIFSWIVVAIWQGFKISAVGSVMYMATLPLATLLQKLTRRISVFGLIRQLLGQLGTMICYLVASATFLIWILFSIMALLRWPDDSCEGATPGFKCQSPNPNPTTSVPTYFFLPCSKVGSEAAWGTANDYKVIDFLEKDVQQISIGPLRNLSVVHTQESRHFVWQRDFTRTQYNVVLNRLIARFLIAQKKKLIGEVDETCLQVEWEYAVAGLASLASAGTECEASWEALYMQHNGTAHRLKEKLLQNMKGLKNSRRGVPGDLLPGMSKEGIRRSLERLSAYVGLLDTLEEAHASSKEVACIKKQRDAMTNQWANIAGVEARKIENATQLEQLKEARLDWTVVHSPSKTDEVDASESSAGGRGQGLRVDRSGKEAARS